MGEPEVDAEEAPEGSDRWGNERYVRLLTRETADRAAWCWQARALMPWLLAKADGAGLLETSKGARGIAAITMLPVEVVTPGLAELEADQFVVAVPGGYLIRNFIAVQNAKMSDSQRQARARDRKRAESALASRSVTDGHAESRDVTPSHAASRGDRIVTPDVTPSRSDPSQAKPNQAEDEGDRFALAPAPARKPRPAKPDAPGLQDTVAAFQAAYIAQNGVKPTWGDKQIAQLRRLLSQHGADEVQRRIAVLFGDACPAFLANGSSDVGTLVQHFDKLAKPITRGPPRGFAPPGSTQIALSVLAQLEAEEAERNRP